MKLCLNIIQNALRFSCKRLKFLFKFIARHFLLVARCLLLFVCYWLLSACCLLIFVCCSLFLARCFLPVTLSSLLYARCSHLFAHRAFLSICSFFLTFAAAMLQSGILVLRCHQFARHDDDEIVSKYFVVSHVFIIFSHIFALYY